MRMASPVAMAVFYLLLGVVLSYFATRQVGENGWTIWSFIIVALAAYDFYMGFRFLRLRKVINEMRDNDENKR